jgi:hypothetical protein
MTRTTRVLASDGAFVERERALLEALAALMIPAGDGLPSAADATIFAEVLGALGQRADVVRAGLDRLVELAAAAAPAAAAAGAGAQQPFPTLDAAAQMRLVEALRAEVPGFVTLFESSVAACYYQDDRVLRSLDLPARAPFPEGNEVGPTDWSLLDPVRARQPFYRNV